MPEQAGVIVLQQSKKRRFNQRRKTIFYIVFAAAVLAAVVIAGTLLGGEAVTTHAQLKNLAPSAAHPFGTDWLGRDMLARTLKGLSISIFIGLAACVVSAVLGGLLGTLAATLGRAADGAISFLIDVMMGVPHILLLLLLSFALGKGMFGIMVAVAVSHWPSLARVIRGEVIALRQAPYVQVARRLGQGPLTIARRHMLPHIFPQFLCGLILLFPHAIIHEAALTFLGFGLRPEQPGIGIVLSESMKYLSLGMWWLAVFPGVALLLTVLLGGSVRKLTDPRSAQL